MKHITSNSQIVIESDPLHSKEISESKDAGIDKKNLRGGADKIEEIIIEPVEENPYDLSYTCLLLPRLSSDVLLGDVAVGLRSSLEQICISFGWHLEFLSIKADYLHWTVRVPPATSTAYFMQVIREETSRHLFANFPRLIHEKLSNDFWAPGYLIFWGSQPHPVEIIQRFIHQTRQHLRG